MEVQMFDIEGIDTVKDDLLKASDVAKRFKICKSLAYRLMQLGEIPTVRFNRTVRVRESDLEGFILSHLVSQE